VPAASGTERPACAARPLGGRDGHVPSPRAEVGRAGADNWAALRSPSSPPLPHAPFAPSRVACMGRAAAAPRPRRAWRIPTSACASSYLLQPICNAPRWICLRGLAITPGDIAEKILPCRVRVRVSIPAEASPSAGRASCIHRRRARRRRRCACRGYSHGVHLQG
jgi:hypothetical protein